MRLGRRPGHNSFEVSDVAANQAANRPAGVVATSDGLDDESEPPTIGNTALQAPHLGVHNITRLEMLSTSPISSVYSALQSVPHRRVAVKVLHDDLTSETGQRFDRERTVAGQLSGHSAVVPLFESGITTQGEPYLVMPLYSRGSMARLMAEHGRLPWQQAAYLIETVAVTLAEVHSRGIVHRNLKPENVLLTDFLLPRVGDFGLSLAIGETATARTAIATPFYSAPEAVVPGSADPTADVYGLGALLWALLSGQGSFATDLTGVAARTATAQARTGRPLPPAMMAPESIRDLISRSMADEPDTRPANAATFVSELRRSVARPTQKSATAASPGIDLSTDVSPAGGDGELAPSSTPPTTTAPRSTAPAPAAIPASASTSTAPPARSEPGVSHSPATDARYVLVLVGCITVAIVAMVAAAMMTVG